MSKTTNEDLKKLKVEIRQKNDMYNLNILTSEYYQYFDLHPPKEMNCRQNHYLQMAAKVAMRSQMNHQHGCVLVYKKDIISVGHNYYHGTASIHAEIAAIQNVPHKYKPVLSKCQLYVVRIAPQSFKNALKYSKPCNCCQNYITKKNIKNVFYSTHYEFDRLFTMSRRPLE
jgi:deoxycytidylate deaminase